jgi:hypothetical protein
MESQAVPFSSDASEVTNVVAGARTSFLSMAKHSVGWTDHLYVLLTGWVLGCFQSLATVIKCCCEYLSASFYVGLSPGEVLSRTTGSSGNSMFNFLRNCQAFPKVTALCYSPTSHGPVSPHCHRHVLSQGVFILANLVGVEVHLIML